jgi:hypothetical protein
MTCPSGALPARHKLFVRVCVSVCACFRLRLPSVSFGEPGADAWIRLWLVRRSSEYEDGDYYGAEEYYFEDEVLPPPPPSPPCRTNRTRLVPPPVLSGHVLPRSSPEIRGAAPAPRGAHNPRGGG